MKSKSLDPQCVKKIIISLSYYKIGLCQNNLRGNAINSFSLSPSTNFIHAIQYLPKKISGCKKILARK